MPGANRNNVRIHIELDKGTMTRLNAALRILGEKDAPFLREALDDVGQRFAGEVRARAPGGIAAKAKYRGVKGSATGLAAKGVDDHPGARSMEFGRVWYYAGYKGRNVKSGRKVRRTGQKARPFMGIIAGDKAYGAVQPYARERLLEAVNREWERLGSG